MFGFLVKKAFFDMWDNLFRIIIMNLGYIAVFAIFFLLAPVVHLRPRALSAHYSRWASPSWRSIRARSAGCARKSRTTISPGFQEFFQFLKESYPSSLLCALVYPRTDSSSTSRSSSTAE